MHLISGCARQERRAFAHVTTSCSSYRHRRDIMTNGRFGVDWSWLNELTRTIIDEKTRTVNAENGSSTKRQYQTLVGGLGTRKHQRHRGSRRTIYDKFQVYVVMASLFCFRFSLVPRRNVHVARRDFFSMTLSTPSLKPAINYQNRPADYTNRGHLKNSFRHPIVGKG